MVKKTTLIALLLFLITQSLQAQVKNGGFEMRNPDGSPKNWGTFVQYSLSCDTIYGEDSVYFLSTDAYNGQYALCIGNSYCTDNNGNIVSVLNGSASLREPDTVNYQTGVPITVESGMTLEFYYKYYPQGDDTAFVEFVIDDVATGQTMHDMTVAISRPALSYSKAILPILYTGSPKQARMYITFSINNRNANVRYGSSMFIDEVTLNKTTVGIQQQNTQAYNVYPNPAKEQICITGIVAGTTMQLYDVFGRQVAFSKATSANAVINISHLATGNYALYIYDTDGNHAVRKIIKQ